MFRHLPTSFAVALAAAVSVAGCDRRAPAADPATAPAPRPAAPAIPTGVPGATDRPAATPSADDGLATRWLCGDKPVEAVFEPAEERVQLAVDGLRLSMHSTETASGARYADAQGNTFQEHQGEATLTLAGGEALKCSKQASGVTG
nr:MliC family protein [Xanthomonas sp.]